MKELLWSGESAFSPISRCPAGGHCVDGGTLLLSVGREESVNGRGRKENDAHLLAGPAIFRQSLSGGEISMRWKKRSQLPASQGDLLCLGTHLIPETLNLCFTKATKTQP